MNEQKAVSHKKQGERGATLVVALLIMLFLFTLVATFLTISLTEHRITRNVVNSAKALQFADSGIEHSRRALLYERPSAILDGTAGFGPPGTPPFGPTATLEDGTYSVQITNNNAGNGFPRGTIPADPSGSATADGDRILVVTSNASYREGSRTVEAVIQVAIPASGAVYLMNGTDAGGPVEVEDFEPNFGAGIDGIDCNPASAGGGPGPGPHVTGIAVENALAQSNVMSDLGADSWGVTGVNGSGDVQQAPNAMTDADLAAWLGDLLAQSTPVGTGACTAPQIGTWASPQICNASGPGNLSDLVPDGTTGAGILIINDLDLVTPELSGSTLTNFVYEGIVIMVGDGRFRLEGSSRIYGTLIQNNIVGNHSGQTRLRMSDDSRICYSSLAVRHAQGNLGDLLAWRDY